MLGVGHTIAILFLASAPGSAELPGARSTPAPKPMASAVDLGSKWGIVTSVRRSPEHNRAVGGAVNSFHLSGRAIDIARRAGVRHGEIEAAYRRAGYVLIESLDEGDHSHFAFGTLGDRMKSAAPKTEQFASNSPSPAAKCLTDAAPLALLKGRRRPDRSDGCEDAAEPAPRLTPLQATE